MKEKTTTKYEEKDEEKNEEKKKEEEKEEVEEEVERHPQSVNQDRLHRFPHPRAIRTLIGSGASRLPHEVPQPASLPFENAAAEDWLPPAEC